MRWYISQSLLRSMAQRHHLCRSVASRPLFLHQDDFGSVRHLRLLRIFSKEAREKEKSRLQEELNRGYFDDMKDLKKHGGKVHVASRNLLPVAGALIFPTLDVYFKKGDSISLPLVDCPADATVICIGFRANAQTMIESWSLPFLEAFKSSPNVQLYEVSVVENWLLSVPPVKQLLLRSMKAPQQQLDEDRLLRRNVVFSFGDKYWFRKSLTIPNLLTGYIFLVDKKGRVRWRACGPASDEELAAMISCTSRLLREN